MARWRISWRNSQCSVLVFALLCCSPTLSSKWHFDVDEVLTGGSYNIDLKATRSSDLSDAGDGTDEVVVRSKHGQDFKCHVPKINENEGVQEATAKVSPEEALKQLKDACFQTTSGWWSYEICFGKTLKQFHLLPNGIKESLTLLGTFNESHSSDTGQLIQNFDKGTICDLTGNLREASVIYTCLIGSPEQIQSILEPSTCVYKIQVSTHLLCPKDLGKPVSIPCYPVNKFGEAIQIETDVEHSNSDIAKGMLPDFESGDAWSGKYSCQGEQWLRIRIFRVLKDRDDLKKTTDDTIFSGSLAFRHREANGLYRILGRYSPESRTLALSAGPWIVRPPDFMSINFEGVVGYDGAIVNGIIPPCENGPFTLYKEDKKYTPTAIAALHDINTDIDEVYKDDALDDDAFPPPNQMKKKNAKTADTSASYLNTQMDDVGVEVNGEDVDVNELLSEINIDDVMVEAQKQLKALLGDNVDLADAEIKVVSPDELEEYLKEGGSLETLNIDDENSEQLKSFTHDIVTDNDDDDDYFNEEDAADRNSESDEIDEDEEFDDSNMDFDEISNFNHPKNMGNEGSYKRDTEVESVKRRGRRVLKQSQKLSKKLGEGLKNLAHSVKDMLEKQQAESEKAQIKVAESHTKLEEMHHIYTTGGRNRKSKSKES